MSSVQRTESIDVLVCVCFEGRGGGVQLCAWCVVSCGEGCVAYVCGVALGCGVGCVRSWLCVVLSLWCV